MSFKIAIIGAGSVGFTKKLFTDILCVPEFKDIEFALTDISEHNLRMIKAILDRIVEANKLPTKVTATTDRRKALEGALTNDVLHEESEGRHLHRWRRSGLRLLKVRRLARQSRRQALRGK